MNPPGLGFQSSQPSKMDVASCVPESCYVKLLADSGYTWFAFPYTWFAFPSSFSNPWSSRQKEFFPCPIAYSSSHLLTFSRGRSSGLLPLKLPVESVEKNFLHCESEYFNSCSESTFRGAHLPSWAVSQTFSGFTVEPCESLPSDQSTCSSCYEHLLFNSVFLFRIIWVEITACTLPLGRQNNTWSAKIVFMYAFPLAGCVI